MSESQFSPSDYLDAAAPLLQLPIPPEARPGVIANLERLNEIAQLVLEYPLPESTDPAPVFEP
ncbi:MAG: DUF4089 domain-containing protein [Spirulinaceae cyanobacterium SM2_1_0]|nr:DUF4089 domain-containing protein [Spirulinaceae cyanobacterium SM2_1_0]